MYYENEFDRTDMSPEDYGFIDKSEVPDLDLCRSFLNKVLDSVYKTGDVIALEDSLDELCGLLEVQMNNSLSPLLTKKHYIIDRIPESNFINFLEA